jgi:hypothetical protein
MVFAFIPDIPNEVDAAEGCPPQAEAPAAPFTPAGYGFDAEGPPSPSAPPSSPGRYGFDAEDVPPPPYAPAPGYGFDSNQDSNANPVSFGREAQVQAGDNLAGDSDCHTHRPGQR